MGKLVNRYLVNSISIVGLKESIDSYILMFQREKEKWTSEGYTNIDIEGNYYNDNCYLEIYGDRLETDKEKEIRMKREQEEEVRKSNYELMEYERLQKKFGKV